MIDTLLLQYPNKADKINNLRSLGVSDEDIEKGMQEKITSLREQGVTMPEINQALGFDEKTRSKLFQAKVDNTLEYIGTWWKVGPEKAKEALDFSQKKNIPVNTVMAYDKLPKEEPFDLRKAVGKDYFYEGKFNDDTKRVMRNISGVSAGLYASAGSFARGAEWATGWDSAKNVADYLYGQAEKTGNLYKEPGDHGLWDDVMSGLGSTVMFLVPGMIVGKGATLASAGASAMLGIKEQTALSLAKWTGATVSGVLEGFAEAGDVYGTVLENTGDEGAASMAASKTFWMNIPLNIVLDKFAFFDDASDSLKRFFMKRLPEQEAIMLSGIANRFPSEFIQETAQGIVSEQAVTNKDWSDIDYLGIASSQGLTGGIAASIFGLGMGLSQRKQAMKVETQTQKDERINEINNIFETVKETAISAGVNAENADASARVLSSFYNTMSKRYGVSASELFTKRGLTIQKEQTETEIEAGNVYKQDGDVVPKGQIAFVNGQATISLFATSDQTTLIHEFSHLMLEEFSSLSQIETAPEGAISDWNELRSWLGVEDDTSLSTEAHEKFAKGLEKYLLEGKAPTTKLQVVFETFKKWLIDSYRNLKLANIEMSSDIKNVFDRLLATEDEINAEAEREALLATQVKEDIDLPSMSEEEKLAISEADAALNGNEEILFSSDWFTGFESEAPAGQEQVDMFTFAQEELALQKEQLSSWKEFTGRITEMGGITYESVKEYFGKDKAQVLWKTARSIFDPKGSALDEILANLEDRGLISSQNADLLFQIITNKPTINVQIPVIELTEDTVPWLEDRLGASGAVAYIRKRISGLEKFASVMTNKLEELKNSGTDGKAIEDARASLQETYLELNIARNALADISTRVETDTRKDTVVDFPFKEEFATAKLQAARWSERKIKDIIKEVTGQTKVGALMTEDMALREAMRTAERNSRIAYYAGNKAGVIKERMRRDALLERKKARAEQKKEIASIIKFLDNAMLGDIRVSYKEKIRDLLSGYDLRKPKKLRIPKEIQVFDEESELMSQQTEVSVKPSDEIAIRKDLEAYLADHPDAIPQANTEDVYYLGRKTISSLSIDELRSLRDEVKEIRIEGAEAFKLWKAENQERVDKKRDALLKTVGGRKRPIGELVDGKLTKKESKRLKIALWTWLPDSVTKYLDGDVKGKGTFHKFFVDDINDADNARARIKQRRQKRMTKALEILGFKGGVDNSHWYEERTSDIDPVTGAKAVWSVDGLLNIYIGWQNRRFRDALMYGSNITEARYNELMTHLTPQEKEAAWLVVQDHSSEKEAINKVFEDVFNKRLADEDNYIRLYRDSAMSDKKLLDSNSSELLEMLLKEVNGVQKFYPAKGFTFDRKDIPAEIQAKIPPKLGLFSNWQSAMEEEAHWIGYAQIIKDLHSVLDEKWDPSIPTLKESVTEKWGKETSDFLIDYVNRISRAHFYMGYTSMDSAMRWLRKNMSIAYLGWNYMTWAVQTTVLALTLPTVGSGRMMHSISEFIAHPEEMVKRVWELDPQVAEQAMTRTMEEMKRTMTAKKMDRFIKTGFKPLMWFDMFARVVVWDAMYQKVIQEAKSNGMDIEQAHEEAVRQAQQFVLKTNNAAHPKDLPRFMATNETLNLLAIFSNQANKIWNLSTYDVPASLKQGEYKSAFATVTGIMMMGIMTSMLRKGELPDDEEELLTWIGSEAVQSIPLAGKPLMSAMEGYSNGSTVIDTGARDIMRILKNTKEGEFFTTRNAGAILEVYALARGIPYTPIKRVMRAAETGNPLVLLGWAREERAKRKRRVSISY